MIKWIAKKYLIKLFKHYSYQVESLSVELGYADKLTEDEVHDLQASYFKFKDIRKTLGYILEEVFETDTLDIIFKTKI